MKPLPGVIPLAASLFVVYSSARLGVATGAESATTPDSQRPTLYYIPHTHWEGAVFKTREDYLEMGLPNILQALRLLKTQPNYRFALDQVAYIRPFLERYPEEAAAFRRFIAEGRLEIVGGMDVMPDVVKPGGELFVRQVQYGKDWCREHLGVDVKVAWFLDTFGHHPQMPQLLRQAGFTSFWFCRGVPRGDLPSEFFWEGIDGTRIQAMWLPGFYGLFYGPPRTLPEFTRFFDERFHSLDPHVTAPERVGLAGVDVSEPESYVAPLIEAFNQQANAPFTIRPSLPSEFAAVVARRTNTSTLRGDFNPIFQGTYSSRSELKQRTRHLEERLLTAEKLGALAQWLGGTSDQAQIWRAWEPVLFNQTHDLASGVMTDYVYEDTVRSYDFSERLAQELIESHWNQLAQKINTLGEGIPIAVFNSLGWSRTDAAEIEVGFAESGVKDVALHDTSGAAVPVQLIRGDRYADGGLKRVRLVFVARDVPALGYVVYRLRPLSATNSLSTSVAEEKNGHVLENESLRATFNSATGELTSLLNKSGQWEALSGSANVVTRQRDRGDLWELYRGLNGGSYIAMTNRQTVPAHGAADFSNEFSGEAGTVRRGPVYSEFTVEHPFTTNGAFATTVRLYAGLRRLEFTTQVMNREKHVRYQVLFPSSIRNGQQVQEIPFGAVARPAGIEFPAQNWMDWSDGRHGLALLNAGLPGNVITDGTLMLSLQRAHNLGAYGFGGGYEPGMSSESGFQSGRTSTFRYALVPHAGDWREAAVFRDGFEFNHPLIVRKIAPHPGSLPSRWGLVEISAPNVVLTACKAGRKGATIIRVYEAAGKPTPHVRLRIAATVNGAIETNLIEDPGAEIKVQDGALEFDLHPFEIKTLSVQLKSRASGVNATF